AGGQQLGDGAEVVLRNVDGELLERLMHLAVDLPGHDLRLADGEFNPSRRICSTRMASASSPRPWTSQASGRSVGTTLSETLPTSSWSRRSLTMRAVTFVPFSRPASGEVLMPTVIEIAGSSMTIA